MKDKTLYHLHADVCKALAHSTRIEIIDILQYDELTFGEIADKAGIPNSSLSQHLSLMVNNGILIQRKAGLNTHFRLSSKKVFDACLLMREILIEKLQKSKKLLEKM